jgi:hypothetical protein
VKKKKKSGNLIAGEVLMSKFTILGSAAASRVYVDAITKLARQAQQATWSGCSDIGNVFSQK